MQFNEIATLIAGGTRRVTAPIEFGGRIVMVGCGSIGQAILPLLRRHLALAAGSLIVLAADEVGRGIAQQHGAKFIYAHLKPRSFRRILARHLRRGDLLLNLSVDVSSLDLLTYASERGALYVDTSIEPWPGVFDNPMLDLRQRSNFTTRAPSDAARRRAGTRFADRRGRSRRQPGARVAFREARAARARSCAAPRREPARPAARIGRRSRAIST